MKEITYAALIRKINEGKLEAMQDVKVGKHCEVRNCRTGAREMYLVK